MGKTDKLKGTKCFDDACDNSGNLDLESCVTDTTKECTLGKGELGSQEVAIKNAKRHAVDVSVSLESQNQTVEYGPDGDTLMKCDMDFTVGPSKMSSQNLFPFSIEIRQTTQTKLGQIAEETLEVETEYEYHRSSRDVQSGPVVYPKIDLE